MMALIEHAPLFTAAFVASFVEFVEALTVVLAASAVRGWRSALAGVIFGLLALAALITAFGPFVAKTRLPVMQLVIGILVLLFGLRWTRKAILRAAGILPLHDEAAAYARTSSMLAGEIPAKLIDAGCFATCMNIVLLEGLEVVFIVVSLSAHAGLETPLAGALAAFLLVCLLGLALHRPLAMIPENGLKFLVGLMLTSFGTFWTGEGLGISWPGNDLALLFLFAGYLSVSLALVRMVRQPAKIRLSTQ